MERCVKPATLKSIRSVESRVAVLKEHLGELPLDALEESDEINRFKSDSEYAEQVEVATIHRACPIFVTRDGREPQNLVAGARNHLNLEFAWAAA